ncbi:hypothetical protein EUX98_g4738 [Antrodiella citrinella]|uniref:Amidohydrolase-related domain-containing protein n=1 Tax=Antrodiella citrinella TaxID=2447956 RepID=A0A4V3XIJ0_9APHY|nr:hypothetical protein EUX98_g4738 [Antrodiella citrinella]
MGKNKKNATPGEENLHLPPHPFYSESTADANVTSFTAIVDTHTHLVSTFESYVSAYPQARYLTIHDFVRGFYTSEHPSKVEAIVDVWCEAPVTKTWKEIADSALTEESRRDLWGGIEYWFVIDEVERDILEAMTHPRCVGWGEMGLDYHYDNSPRQIQQDIFIRQLRHAVRLGKTLTIHTREAEEDSERILKAEVPKDHKIHIHCYTDSPEWASRMLDHFPNLHIGITGVITYTTNLTTSAVIRQMTFSSSASPTHPSPRILLETDAPFMTPSNLYNTLPALKNRRLPLSLTSMIPWTAEFVARVANEGRSAAPEETDSSPWDIEKVMRVARQNAKTVYGV